MFCYFLTVWSFRHLLWDVGLSDLGISLSLCQFSLLPDVLRMPGGYENQIREIDCLHSRTQV